jgi:putative membrane protein insertion efficiency factor
MRRLIRILIRIYQVVLSPLLVAIGGPGSGCRFQPTCSKYFLQSVDGHGVFRGGWLGLKRIARCHPWGGSGHDPVPARERIVAKPTEGQQLLHQFGDNCTIIARKELGNPADCLQSAAFGAKRVDLADRCV